MDAERLLIDTLHVTLCNLLIPFLNSGFVFSIASFIVYSVTLLPQWYCPRLILTASASFHSKGMHHGPLSGDGASL